MQSAKNVKKRQILKIQTSLTSLHFFQLYRYFLMILFVVHVQGAKCPVTIVPGFILAPIFMNTLYMHSHHPSHRNSRKPVSSAWSKIIVTSSCTAWQPQSVPSLCFCDWHNIPHTSRTQVKFVKYKALIQTKIKVCKYWNVVLFNWHLIINR